MDWITVALWALVFIQAGWALYYDFKDDDMKCIKHYLFAFALMWAMHAEGWA